MRTVSSLFLLGLVIVATSCFSYRELPIEYDYSYYGRFTVYINGVDAISAGTWTHSNYGYTGGIDPDNLRIGRYVSGNYMQNSCKVDEFAVWDSER